MVFRERTGRADESGCGTVLERQKGESGSAFSFGRIERRAVDNAFSGVCRFGAEQSDYRDFLDSGWF